jgi:hypothetical protein
MLKLLDILWHSTLDYQQFRLFASITSGFFGGERPIAPVK